MQKLNLINTYADFKKLKRNELDILAKEIRQKLILLSKDHEIHLSSNLGIVELSIAIAYSFDLDKDKLYYDTGHQGYVHKMITGRNALISTIRKDNGLTGLIDMNESIYDHYSPGHCGNTLSIGAATALVQPNQYVINVIGDSAFATGVALEAINFISFNNLKQIIIINDNNMSISKATGELSKTFLNQELSKQFFNSLGYYYIGFIDGHNFNDLFHAFDTAKKIVKNQPIIIHVKTIKGKGIVEAEKDVIGQYHSNSLKQSFMFGHIAADFLYNKMQNDNNLYVLNPAMNVGSGFSKLYIDKLKNYYDTGIGEQHTISFASGLVLNNKKVYCCFYSSFLQRPYDQLLHDVARLKLNLTLLIDRADLSGGDGPSHHGIFDVGFLKSIPYTTICSPRNKNQLTQLLNLSYINNDNIFAIRYPKTYFVEEEYEFDFNIKFGIWEHINTLKKQTKICIVSYGPFVNKIYKTFIEQNINVDIINAIFIHNFNQNEIINVLKKYDYIICYERIFSNLGLYSDLCIWNTNMQYNKKIININYKNIPKNGSNNQLDKDNNMDIDYIIYVINFINDNIKD